MPRALLSVSDKTGIVDFARALAARGYDLVSSGGTASALAAAGLPVTAVSEVTGFPEMMDGRVKTLHPRVHGGILARRDRADHLEAARRHGITLIDLVVVNLYPFARAAADPATPFDALVEEIDIGGPSLVRAAAKSFHDVLVVVSPADYPRVLDELAREGGPSVAFRFELARKAFEHTAHYDAEIASTLSGVEAADGFRRGPRDRAPLLTMTLRKLRDLRYGENPHQAAAWYGVDGDAGFGRAAVLQGKELSFTNLLDLDAALAVVREFEGPAAVVIKHTNPCGAATGETILDAYVRARDADARAAFGGIVGLNRRVDEAAARAIASTFIEAVVAPGFADDARAVLAAKQNLRLVSVEFDRLDRRGAREIRSIAGAALVQERDRVDEAATAWPPADLGREGGLRVVTRRAPTSAEWKALRFAWRVCAHVKSNAVIFTAADRTIAIGAGQMSRVDAVDLAIAKAGPGELKDSVAASDAFFPFRDGVDKVAGAGATAVVQPGGSVRDAEVIAAADEHDLAMVFTGRRHFRH